jgi:hypothetical protein
MLLVNISTKRITSAAVPAKGINIKPVNLGDRNPRPKEIMSSKLCNIAFAQAQSKTRFTPRSLHRQSD